MTKLYYKEGKRVAKPLSIKYNNSTFINPSDDLLRMAGYEIEVMDSGDKSINKKDLIKSNLMKSLRNILADTLVGSQLGITKVALDKMPTETEVDGESTEEVVAESAEA